MRTNYLNDSEFNSVIYTSLKNDDADNKILVNLLIGTGYVVNLCPN